MGSSAIQIYELGDQALTIEWSSTIYEAANQKVMRAFRYWQKNPIVGVTDIIPAYSSLTLVYDAAIIQQQSRGLSPTTWLSQQINSVNASNHEHMTDDQVIALDMICNKMARIVNGDPSYIDNWHDISGYATLVEQELNTTNRDGEG